MSGPHQGVEDRPFSEGGVGVLGGVWRPVVPGGGLGGLPGCSWAVSRPFLPVCVGGAPVSGGVGHPGEGGSAALGCRRVAVFWAQFSDWCGDHGGGVGIEDSLIKTLGRWESSAYLLYVRVPRERLAGVARLLTAAT